VVKLNERFYINIDEGKRKFDGKKITKCLLPNTAHYIDATLMYKLLILYWKKYSIISIHDCFYTNFFYFKEVKEAYVNAFAEVFKDDVYFYFKK